MKTESHRFIIWLPRIVNLALALFLSIFSLDVFEEGYSIGKLILALLMHLLPSLALIILLGVSWKRPQAGALVFPLLALSYAWISRNNLSAIAAIGLPLLITGLLYWWSYRVMRDKT
jgi:hypothetical protein